MRKILGLLISSVVLSGTTGAASKVGNGGYGVKIKGSIFALDLATSGVHRQPYLSEQVNEELEQDYKDLLHYHLKSVSEPPVIDLVERKLVELKQRIAELKLSYKVETVLEKMDEYRWVNTIDLDCLDVQDDKSPYPEKVQLAFRKDRWVKFCKNYSSLDDTNKAAIDLHEIFYAAHPEGQPNITGLVGFLFSRQFADFDARGAKELTRLLRDLQNSSQNGPPVSGFFPILKQAYKDGRIASDNDLARAYIAGKCVSQFKPTTIVTGALLFYELPKDPDFGRQIKADFEVDAKGLNLLSLDADSMKDLHNHIWQDQSRKWPTRALEVIQGDRMETFIKLAT